jgi:hypothetical protein
MARSRATTVEAYLDEQPEERRAVLAAVRKVIKRNLPKGYREVMNWGMISYEVPLERFPNTYNGQPLSYAGLAAQKNYFVLHLMPVYMNDELLGWLCEEFRKAGKKLDMGKACIRFRQLDDLPLDAIGQVVALFPPEKWIALYEASRKRK